MQKKSYQRGSDALKQRGRVLVVKFLAAPATFPIDNL